MTSSPGRSTEMHGSRIGRGLGQGWAWWLSLLGLLIAAPAGYAQREPVHYFQRGDMPAGAIGQGQLLRGGPLPGYFQPVEIKVPPGAAISLAEDGLFGASQSGAVLTGLLIGQVYPLKITGIPRREGVEVFPTIELVNRLYPPPGLENHFPVPIQLTQEELEMAISGRFVTRWIYLEDAHDPLPVRDDPLQQRYFEVAADDDPLQAADRLGRPVAILRMGSRTPAYDPVTGRFAVGSPPWRGLERPAPLPDRRAGLEPAVAPGGVPRIPPLPYWPMAATPPGSAAPPYCAPPEMAAACPPGCVPDMPGADAASGWQPPGIAGPWPRDEYLFDGGDHQPTVDVQRDRSVLGLDQEDTVAHFETLDGRTQVVASNRVPIYAPRFAAVRKAYGVISAEYRDRPIGVQQPVRLGMHEENRLASHLDQPVPPIRLVGTAPLQTFQEDVRPGGVERTLPLARLANRFKPYEDFQIIRAGRFDNSEKLRISSRLAAARAWNADQAVQVSINHVTATLAAGTTGLESVYEYEVPPGKPRLRVVKVASQAQAQPGEQIEFSLRFDNVGDQTIGNVTILDNLTTRLEYLPDSAECSVAANFFTQQNDGDSLTLRWELVPPLKVGQGGVIRFKCRVR